MEQSRINAYEIIERTLNLKNIKIFDTITDSDGKKIKREFNAQETAIAQKSKSKSKLKQAFEDWIFTNDVDREETISNII